MKTEIVKDFTFGILIMVISQFFLAGVYYIISPSDWWVLPSILFLSICYYILFGVGWKLAFEGIEIDRLEK